MKLSGAVVGRSYRVSAVSGSQSLVLRLKEMGITEGVRLRVLRKAPFGGPIEVEVRGYCITLRRDEAEMVELQS